MESAAGLALRVGMSSQVARFAQFLFAKCVFNRPTTVYYPSHRFLRPHLGLHLFKAKKVTSIRLRIPMAGLMA